MDLLDGVSAVDWTSFKQESGDAPRIPTLFEKLLDAKAAVRSRAAQDLARALVPYDGYVRAYFHVGLEAVPFVARLATAPESPVRAPMLRLLGDLAAGNHRRHLERGFHLELLDDDEIGPGREVHAAVVAAVDGILPQLRDSDADVRASAAFALAWLPSEAPRSIDALLEGLASEKSPASSLLALGYVARAAGRADLGRVLRAHTQDKPPAGYAAVLGALLADPDGMDDLEDTALAGPPKPVVKGLPFNGGALGQLGHFIVLGATCARCSLARHLQLVDKARQNHPAWLARVVSWSVFPAAGSDGARRAELLNPQQISEEARGVLRDLARGLSAPPSAPEALLVADFQGFEPARQYTLFRRVGLFGSRGHNERALGLEPPGPLDRVVDGAPLWHWLSKARDERISFDDWRARVSEDELLAVCEDAAAVPFDLHQAYPRSGSYDVVPLVEVIERTLASHQVPSALAQRFAQLRAKATGRGTRPWPF
ncbi:MAG: hypothetical protein H6717_08295 [Polyangiaceae bacterium]|nr:hypothetical protein [Polyangiaceae bacterium]